MLDRLLMSILRKDIELRDKTIELSSKFNLIEKISYCRCQFYILGGRKEIVQSRRIFLAETVESLQEMYQHWVDKVATFKKKVIFFLLSAMHKFSQVRETNLKTCRF